MMALDLTIESELMSNTIKTSLVVFKVSQGSLLQRAENAVKIEKGPL